MPETSSFLDTAKLLQDELIQLRRHLHAHPELSFQEHNTAKRLAERLAALGYSVKTGVAKTGVVAEIGSGPKTVAVRAEMDALPIFERNTVPYVSQKPGVMHACGHDVNMACVLGAAKILAGEKLPGRVRIILQPAAEESHDEQGKAGTQLMIEQGALDDVSAVIALHIDGTIAAGKVGIILESSAAGTPNCFSITITCKKEADGNARDALLVAARVIQALHERAWSEAQSGEEIVTVGCIRSSSTRPDSLSDEVVMQGAFRSFSKAMRRTVMAHIEQTCSLVTEQGAEYAIEFDAPSSALLSNDPQINDLIRQVATDLIGPDRVLTVKRKTWTEDFSKFLEHVPGALMLLGGEIEWSRRSAHSPEYDVDESGLYIGAAILADTARRLLSQ